MAEVVLELLLKYVYNSLKIAYCALQFDQAGLRMADRSYYFLDATNPRVAAYKNYMKTIVQLFDTSVDDAEANKFVESTFNFEKKLAEVSCFWIQ